MNDSYEDIINLPHYVSQKRRRMSAHDRAAQFSPFSSLTGYGAAVRESARLTDEKIEIDENSKQLINNILTEIQECPEAHKEIKITYFQADKKKSGGAYISLTGTVKKIDTQRQAVIFEGGEAIPVKDIYSCSFV